jgi:hypothetical protein
MPDKICKKHQINFEDNPELFSITVDYNYYNKVRIKKIIRTRCILCKRIGQKKYSSKEEVKENRRPYFRVYEKKRRKTDIIWKIKKNLRHRVWAVLKGANKSAKTIELLGCSLEELKKHLEKKFEDGMDWNNYGVWHLDHIIGCANFDLSDPEQQKICFHYTNLQPMWGEKNIQKGSRLI